MSVRMLHVADAHLGAPLGNFGDYARARRTEHEAAFRRAIQMALDERVHVVLVAGDLFDTFRPEAEAVNLARRELGRLREAGIKVFGVPGTHDSMAWAECVYRREALPFDRLFTEPTFEHPSTLEIEGTRVTIYGIAYDPDRGAGWETLRRGPGDGIHVALVHAACRFSPAWPVGPEDLPFEEADLPGMDMDYIALGHYHNTRVFKHGKRVLAAYSGSLEGRDWTETGPRHALVVQWGKGSSPTLRPVPLQSRLLESVELDVSGALDEAALIEAIEEACDPQSLWRVTLTGEPEIVPRPHALAATLAASYGHVHVTDETTLVASHVLADRVEEETVRGEFFRRLVAARERAGGQREREVAERALKLGLKVFG